ncbi:MAG: hypothetical protein ABTQ31_10120 [Rhizobiaceae bacterium]
MAKLDFAAFGDALQQRLDEIGYSLRRAEQKWPETNRATLSHAINGKRLSPENYLLLCELAGLDPYRFLSRDRSRRFTRKSIFNQLVKARVSRGTEKF